jgi:signal transduction histidine kinase
VGHTAIVAQVLTNLIGNGIKFAAGGQAAHVRVHAEHVGDKIRVWVDDRGIGIKPEHQDRIFQVFQRLHTTKAFPGTGIGLAIVRKGVEKLGGAVGVVSEVDHGSRFWIELGRGS